MLGQEPGNLVRYSSITAPKVEQKVKVSSKTCLWHGWDLYLCIYHRSCLKCESIKQGRHSLNIVKTLAKFR